jgi:hypothetical protein
VAVKISDHPNQTENEPEVLYTGLHHAREPGSMMAIIYYMWYLLDNYGTDPIATYLVNHRQIWFIPVVNPDGYIYNQQTNPNGGGMWRLNARDNNDNGVYFESGIDGVDLNRNYGYRWGYDNIGSSPIPGSSTYRGPAPFSEVETSVIRDFCNQHQFMTAFNYHTFGNLLIHPWAYNDSPTPDHFYFHTFGSEMIRYNGYTLGTPGQTVGYSVNGDANDWMYGEQATKSKIIAYTPEVGTSNDYFWPPTSRILPLVQENLYPNIILSYVAGFYPSLFKHDVLAYGQNAQPDPGELVEIYPYLMNFSLQPGNPLQLDLIPRQSFSNMNTSQVFFPAMQPFDSLSAANPWQFQIDYNTPVGTELMFDILVYESGDLITVDSLRMTVGTFQTAFSDSAESGMSGWTTGGTGGNWTTVSTISHSPSHSFTESAGGNYSNYANVWMRSSTIDLTNTANAELTFWTRWDIESDWDFALVEISTNGGTSWTHLVGQYMSAASGIGVQTLGLHGYDGRQDFWVEEKINLNYYCGQNVMIRFRLITDSGVTEDGWYVDDVVIKTLPLQANIPPFIQTATNLGYQYYNGSSYPVDALVFDDQGISQVSLFYSTDGGSTFQELQMSGSDSLYQAAIPPLSPGMSVSYYITAWDQAGTYANYPYKIPNEMLQLQITGSGMALIVDPAAFTFTIPQLSAGLQTLKIINPHTDLVNFSITDLTLPQLTTGSTDYNVQFRAKTLLKHLKNSVALEHDISEDQLSNSITESLSDDQINAIVITDPPGDAGTPGMDIQSVDYSENTFNYAISITYSGPPDTNSITIVSFDKDQNFGTGAYPAPVNYGLGNHDIGSEYDVVFDYANFLGDTLGLPPSVYVLKVSSDSIVPLLPPVLYQVNVNTVTVNLSKIFFPNIFDNAMNVSATALPIEVFSDPDFAPDYGHGNLGGELGSSWITQLDSSGNSTYPFNGSIPAGDSVLLNIKVSAAYPLGTYQGMLNIANDGPVPSIDVPVTMNINIPGIPQIVVDPSEIVDTLQVGTGIHTEIINISNTGNGRLYIIVSDSIINGPDWLAYNTTFAIIEPSSQIDLTVEIDKTNLLVTNRYQAEISISSTDPVQPEVIVPVDIFISSTSSITQNDNVPREFALYTNYPNPFNPSTTISFDLPKSTSVSLEIYNLLGQRVKTIANDYLTAGSYQFIWNGTSDTGIPISTGIYFYQLKTEDKKLIKKMLLTK